MVRRRGLCLTLFLITAALTAQADAASKVERIRELMDLQGIHGMIEAQLRAQERNLLLERDRMLTQMKQAFPVHDDQLWQRVGEALDRFVATSRSAWTAEDAADLYAELYGARLTDDELDAILAYYRSSAGRADVSASHGAVAAWTDTLAARTREAMERSMGASLAELRALTERDSLKGN